MGSPKKDSIVKALTNGGESPVPRRTPAELAREKKLRDDPMAEVHGPLFVTCKRCGNRIKLSPKSSYDPFHWTKHRERCLRKPLGLPRPVRRVPKDAHTPPASKKSPPSSSNTDGDNVTPPPLTPEDERTTSPRVIKQRSPTPTPRRITIPLDSITFPITERWQTWTWSELRYSKWLIDTNLVPVNDEQDDDGDSDILPVAFSPDHFSWLRRGMRNPDSASMAT